MSKLPYHHDWEPEFETSLGLQVKWFGSWGGDPEWVVEPSRLGSDLICFFYLKEGAVTAEINGVAVPLKPGEVVVWRRSRWSWSGCWWVFPGGMVGLDGTIWGSATELALGFALLLAWRMWEGMLDQREYDYTTTILQFPHWLAFIPILISLALLAVAALMTLGEAARDAKRG